MTWAQSCVSLQWPTRIRNVLEMKSMHAATNQARQRSPKTGFRTSTNKKISEKPIANSKAPICGQPSQPASRGELTKGAFSPHVLRSLTLSEVEESLAVNPLWNVPA